MITKTERNKKALQNDNLAKKVAHQMASTCNEPYDDLVQLGRIGLLKAIERYNPETGNALSSFAVPYIRGEIQHYLRDKAAMVKAPRRHLELAAKVRRVARVFSVAGREESEDKIAAAIGLNHTRWQEVKEATSIKVCELKSGFEIGFTPDSSLEDRRPLSSTWLMTSIASLPREPRMCIMDAFFAGLDSATIARRRSLSREQVSLWISDALSRIKQESLHDS